MVSKTRLVEVDGDTARRFFEAGGTIHLHPVGYGMLTGRQVSRAGGFKSVEQGIAEANSDVFRGDWRTLIDDSDPHPANPFRTGEMQVKTANQAPAGEDQ